MQPVYKQKTLIHEKPTHRLIRRVQLQNVSSSGDRKNSVRVQKRFFQPATFGNPNDWRIKPSPKGLKFCKHDHKDLVDIPTEGIDESLHGLGGIEEFPSKNGVFSRTLKLRFGGTRDSGGFGTRLDGLESLQRVTKSSRNRPQSHAPRTKR